MNCPTCGASVEIDQQFCRACGTGLVEGDGGRVRPQMAMIAALLFIFVGIVTAILGDMEALRWLKFAGVFVALAGIFSIAAISLALEMRRPKRKIQKSVPEGTALEKAKTTSRLLDPGENNYVSSVTEDTTELLEHVEAGSRQ